VLIGGAGTALAQAAASVVPGQWLHFTAAENTSWNHGSLLNLGAQTTSTDNATAWSTKGLWNPPTKEFYFVGGGHCGSGNTGCPDTQMVLRYNDSTNGWSATYRDGGHTYEGPTINTSVTANNIHMRLFSSNQVDTYSIASQTWVAGLPSVPGGSPDCCLALEYFPDRNSLITVDSDNGIYEYSFATAKWSSCLFNTLVSCGAPASSNALLCSAHTTAAPWARYDVVHHRMLFGGCTSAYALSPTLGLTKLASAPFDISVGPSGSPITIDPGSGKLVSWDSTGTTYVSDGTSWVNSGPSPFADPVNKGLVCAPVSTYNVVMCFYAGTGSRPVTAATVWLYKTP
jgi:hypothetical protein